MRDGLQKIPNPGVREDGVTEQPVRHWGRLGWFHRQRDKPPGAFLQDRRGATSPKPRLIRADQPDITAGSLGTLNWFRITLPTVLAVAEAFKDLVGGPQCEQCDLHLRLGEARHTFISNHEEENLECQMIQKIPEH